MPIKNAEKYLKECLQSIENQTFTNWELIAVNDNSTDNTSTILKNFAKNNYKIKILNNNGNGIIDALKLAYKNCKGNYITRMDADDLMHPKKIELLFENLKKVGEGLVATALVKYFAENEVKNGYKKYESWLNNLSLQENNFDEIYKECVIPSPCWMMHKSDFEKCNAFNSEIYPEDYDLCFRFYEQKMKITSVKKVLHFWRDYENRTSRTDNNYADNRFLDLKLFYFLKLNYNKNKTLFIWGAGKKGKTIAKKLKENSVNFNWICNNENKIGKAIYDVKLQHFETLEENKEAQIIISIANEQEQVEVKKYLNKLKINNLDVFFFC